MKTSNAQRHEKIQVGYVKRAMDIAADVITCPGGLGDSEYPALEIQLKEFKSPYVLRLTLPAVVYKALSEQMDPLLLYDAIASAVNNACAAVGADECLVRGKQLEGNIVRGATSRHSHTKVSLGIAFRLLPCRGRGNQ